MYEDCGKPFGPCLKHMGGVFMSFVVFTFPFLNFDATALVRSGYPVTVDCCYYTIFIFLCFLFCGILICFLVDTTLTYPIL
jgi:hypothetical protein